MSAVTIERVEAGFGSWEREMEVAGLAAETRRNNLKHGYWFLQWLRDWADPARDGALFRSTAFALAVVSYKKWMIRDGYAMSYVEQAVKAADKLGAWLGIGPSGVPTRDLKAPRTAPISLSPYEQRKFLAAAQKPSGGRWSDVRQVRDYAMVAVMLGCGPRRAELADLDAGDLADGWSNLHIVGGKGLKTRDVPVPRWTRRALAHWFEVHPYGRFLGDGTPLFVTMNGRISADTVKDVVREIGRRAGVRKKIRGEWRGTAPHWLRHTFAANLLRKRVDPVAVAQLLGHSSTDQVMTYGLASEDDLAEAVERPWQ